MPMMDPSLTAYSALKDDDYDSGYLGLDDSQELMKKLGINQVTVDNGILSCLERYLKKPCNCDHIWCLWYETVFKNY